MSKTDSLHKFTYKYLLITSFAVVFTWLIHEFSHWLMGYLLGYEMVMTLNTAYPIDGKYENELHRLLISAAGPLITLFEAIIIFFYMKKQNLIQLYPFLFFCFFMRFLAMMISFLNLNDEARISESLGLTPFTIPLLMTGFLFYLVFKISKQYQINRSFTLKLLVTVSIFSISIIIIDQFLKIRIL
jgi:hypothetical protein